MSFLPYDSFDPLYKSPFGAVPFDQEITFSILLPDSLLPQRCELLLYRADEFDTPQHYPLRFQSGTTAGSRYSCRLQLPQVPQLYFYCFEIQTEGGPLFLRRIDSHRGDFSEKGELWQLTVYDPAYRTPKSPEGIIYHIFPDRFCASGTPKEGVPSDRYLHPQWGGLPRYLPNERGEITNSDYFGGDLRGIEEKLPYLRELGVEWIYLNPIFEAHANHRYNVADYFKVDPLLGTNEDFAHLCQTAKEMGIGIILDGVFSHTGSDSVYFNKEGRYGSGGAYRDPASRYRPWYKFQEYPQKYQSWWGFETLSEVVEENEDYLEFICGEKGVVRYWMSLGAKGFRLDVADELPDIILERLRAAVKNADPEGVLIGEVWEDASNKIAYSQRRRYFLGNQLDSVMNYPFMNAVLRYVRYGDCNALCHQVLTILENYPAPSLRLCFNSLSTHDTPRALTMLAGDEHPSGERQWQADHHFLSPEQYQRGRSLLLIAYTLLYFLPGIPTLYYGDEAGLSGWRDPFNRCPYPWGSADSDLVSRFQELGRLRRQSGFLSHADFLPLISTPDIFIYQRRAQEQILTVAVNRSGQPHPIGAVLPSSTVTHLLTGSYDNGVLAPLSALVLLEENSQDGIPLPPANPF